MHPVADGAEHLNYLRASDRDHICGTCLYDDPVEVIGGADGASEESTARRSAPVGPSPIASSGVYWLAISAPLQAVQSGEWGRHVMSEAVRVVDQDEPQDREVREFFRVAKLVPDSQDVVSVPPGTPVRDALEVMKSGGFSQLPVVAGDTVIGVFSYRSLADGLSLVRRQDDPLSAHVDDLLEDFAFVRASDDVSAILDHLDRDGAVLIGEESHLVAVATESDVVAFLHELTQPFVLLQDIELAVRDLMHSACPSGGELAGRIASALDHDNPPGVLSDLTMGELVTVLRNGDNFGQCFRHTFGKNLDLVVSQLEPAREIRNKVFHFRDDVSVEELNTLVATRRWLLRKVLTVRA